MSELQDKYVVYKPEIGRGSYSKVYKALDKNKKLIAIKKINIQDIIPKLLERIEYEIMIHKKINHPNIVKLHDVYKDDKNICLMLEYCEHDFTTVKCNSENDIKKLKRYIKELNSALKYLKEHNIIHRDLKPKNILISTETDTVKLADFGFASDKPIDMYNTVCGSPLYMAPEIIGIFIGTGETKSAYDSKCDIWSLGLIIYEAYFGVHPFKNSINIMDLYKMIKNGNINFNPNMNDRFSKDYEVLVNLLSRMIVVDVKKRISWNEYFEHEWFNEENCNYNINKSRPINIPTKIITKPNSLPNILNSVCENKQNDVVNKYFNSKSSLNDINDTNDMESLSNSNSSFSQSNSSNNLSNMSRSNSNNDFIIRRERKNDILTEDDLYGCSEIDLENSDDNDKNENLKSIILEKENNSEKNQDIEHIKNYFMNRNMNKYSGNDISNKEVNTDYVIIDEEDILNFEDSRDVTVKDNVINFLSSSFRYIKKPLRYFTL